MKKYSLLMCGTALIGLMLVLLGVSCPSSQTLQLPKIVGQSNCLHSVVYVCDVTGPIGSGVLIGARTVLTARHLLEGATSVIDAKGIVHQIEVAVGDNDSDGAVIYLSTPSECSVTQFVCEIPSLGSPIVGYGLLGNCGLITGMVKGYVVATGASLQFPGNLRTGLVITDTHCVPGCSGGPVFCDGKVIGIHTGSNGRLSCETPLVNFVDLLPME